MNKFVWTLIFLSLMLGSCDFDERRPSVISKTVSTQRINLDVGITVGNHTYLPLNIKGNPNEHVQEILEVLESFEKKYPGLEVISWNIEKIQSGYVTTAYIFGIWVDTRPKPSAG